MKQHTHTHTQILHGYWKKEDKTEIGYKMSYKYPTKLKPQLT